MQREEMNTLDLLAVVITWTIRTGMLMFTALVPADCIPFAEVTHADGIQVRNEERLPFN